MLNDISSHYHKDLQEDDTTGGPIKTCFCRQHFSKTFYAQRGHSYVIGYEACWAVKKLASQDKGWVRASQTFCSWKHNWENWQGCSVEATAAAAQRKTNRQKEFLGAGRWWRCMQWVREASVDEGWYRDSYRPWVCFTDIIRLECREVQWWRQCERWETLCSVCVSVLSLMPSTDTQTDVKVSWRRCCVQLTRTWHRQTVKV